MAAYNSQSDFLIQSGLEIMANTTKSAPFPPKTNNSCQLGLIFVPWFSVAFHGFRDKY